MEKSLLKLFSNPPMVMITYEYEQQIHKVCASLEWYSLTGSIKDRVAYNILSTAKTQGIIDNNTKIVEVSSGNMGLSITAIANLMGLSTTIIMPKFLSKERKDLLKLYGATLVEVDDFKQAFKVCDEYIKNGYFCTNQFENKDNLLIHKKTTAKYLHKAIKNHDLKGFIAGVGTSGTLSGVGEYLKEKTDLKLIAIEPKNAPILSGCNSPKHHQLQGLSDEIVPELYNKNIVDTIIKITDEDALAISQKLARELSLGVGISSGANFLGCVLSKLDSTTIFPDDNKKYLSTNLSTPISTPLVDKIKLLSLTAL